jgi:hypothetical protein
MISATSTHNHFPNEQVHNGTSRKISKSVISETQRTTLIQISDPIHREFPITSYFLLHSRSFHGVRYQKDTCPLSVLDPDLCSSRVIMGPRSLLKHGWPTEHERSFGIVYKVWDDHHRSFEVCNHSKLVGIMVVSSLSQTFMVMLSTEERPLNCCISCIEVYASVFLRFFLRSTAHLNHKSLINFTAYRNIL